MLHYQHLQGAVQDVVITYLARITISKAWLSVLDFRLRDQQTINDTDASDHARGLFCFGH